VRDRLFETSTDHTLVSLRDRDYLITDTVGFIRKLPHLLVDAFASTLEETRMADLLLIVAMRPSPPTRSRPTRRRSPTCSRDRLGRGAAPARHEQGRPSRRTRQSAPRAASPTPSSSRRAAARVSTTCAKPSTLL